MLTVTDGRVREVAAETEQIMREETADTVLQLLTDAVDHGIAQPASIPGYSIAGKTGTAQIAGTYWQRVRTGTDRHGDPIFERVERFGLQVQDASARIVVAHEAEERDHRAVGARAIADSSDQRIQLERLGANP